MKYIITEDNLNTLLNGINNLSAIEGVKYSDIAPLIQHITKTFIKDEDKPKEITESTSDMLDSMNYSKKTRGKTINTPYIEKEN